MNRMALTGMLVVTMLLWSLCYPLIRVGLNHAPPFHFAAMRAVLAGAALCLLAIAMRRPFPRRIRVWLWLGMAGIGATTTGFYGMFFAGGLVSPGLATIMANTQPLIAAGLALLFLHERLQRVQWVGMGLGFAGILGIAFPTLGASDNGASLTGYVYVLVAAVGVAAGNLAIKRVAAQVDVVVGMGIQLLLGAVPLLVMARTLEPSSPAMWEPSFLGVLLLISLAGTALAFVLWCTALRHIQLSRANTFSFLTPLFAIIIGYLGYGERFGWNDALGGGLILLGLWCVSRPSPPSRTAGSTVQQVDRPDVKNCHEPGLRPRW